MLACIIPTFWLRRGWFPHRPRVSKNDTGTGVELFEVRTRENLCVNLDSHGIVFQDEVVAISCAQRIYIMIDNQPATKAARNVNTQLKMSKNALVSLTEWNKVILQWLQGNKMVDLLVEGRGTETACGIAYRSIKRAIKLWLRQQYIFTEEIVSPVSSSEVN